MFRNFIKPIIYAVFLSLSAPLLSADIFCQGPDLSTIVYDYQGVTKLILKRGNALPLSAKCHSLETGELECLEALSGEQIYFRMNGETREARIEIGMIKVYGLKCPLPQKKEAAPSPGPV